MGGGAGHGGCGERLATEHRHQQVQSRRLLVPQPVDLVMCAGGYLCGPAGSNVELAFPQRADVLGCSFSSSELTT